MRVKPGDGMRRRGFLKAAATGAGLLILKPKSALGSEANSKLQLGVIGCGGRGCWIARLFQEHSETRVVAVHDYFRNQVTALGEELGIEASHRYVGLDGYLELLADRVDAVAIESPPYFHPDQTLAAIEAGKHVFLAKPVGVDAPGCAAIVKAARKAEGRLTLLVDFQTRNDPLYREAAQRVHDGMIGKPVCGQAYYHAGRLGVRAQPGSEAARLRNWMFDKALSGDIIVEQNVHMLDVANWLIQGHPVKAHGTGGRRVRTDVGDCWDHFVVTYWYPNDVLLDFSSSQFLYGFTDLCTRIYCEQGTVDTHYGGSVSINGKSEAWPGGVTSQIYQQGAVNNIKDFHWSIVEGKPFSNAQESADSTLACVLGRTAAYEQRTVTWDEMMQANTKLDAQLTLPPDAVDS